MLSFLYILLTIVMIVQVHQSTSGIGTGFTMYRIMGIGHKVLAGDAVLWSGLDGGRSSVVGDPLEVFEAHGLPYYTSSYVEVYRYSGPDYSVTRGREFSRVFQENALMHSLGALLSLLTK